MGMLDYGRDEVDKLIMKLGQDYWEEARKVVPVWLLKKLGQLGNQYDIEGAYLLWMLIHYTKGWQNLSNTDMLWAARALYIDNVSIGQDIPFELPEDFAGERRVQKAFKDLHAWSLKEFPDLLFDKVFKRLANKTAKQIQREMKNLYSEDVSFKQAQSLVLTELPRRVKDHPHWFRDPTTTRSLVLGILH